jgi:hypothetical protein
MSLLIPKSFSTKTGSVQLSDLDTNFTYLTSTVNTALDITGTAVTAYGTLGASGAVTLANNLTVGGTIGSTGAVTLASTLDVTGAATLRSASSTIPTGGRLSGVDVGSIKAPGTVIQVVQTVFNTIWSSASNGTSFYPVTGFTAAITPKFNTSKILVMVHMHCSSGYWEVQGRLTRNTADITESWGVARGLRTRCSFATHSYEAGTTGYRWLPVAYQFLDSPATTSATTYGVSLNGYSTYTIGVNYNVYTDNNDADYYGQPISTITLMEIAQ